MSSHNVDVPGLFIIGKAGSGKDTTAERIIANYPWRFKRYALADAIRKLDNQFFLPTESKPRHRYQHIGQSFRQLDPYVWIRALDREIAEDKLYTPIVTDVRQPNEFEHYTALGYISIHVTASDELRLQRLRERDFHVDESTLHHETETALDGVNCNFEIVNNCDIDTLHAQVDCMLDLLLK